jgi:four helix bundle protein
MQTNKGENFIVEFSFAFAMKIIKYVEKLESNRKYIIARQLLKCGTSIGANIREAQNAESKADFIHKMKLAAKESEETEYWLLLCKEAYDDQNSNELLEDCRSIIKILSKIIGTTKRNDHMFDK